MQTFNAIDIETANADRESICQIGIVHVRDGEIKDQWKTLVNPETWFDPFNVSIHGINEQAVSNSPTLPEVRGELHSRLRGSILVSHTSFDRVALERAMERYSLEQPTVTWLDSARIVRRAWPDKYGKKGYGLKNVARDFDISFMHHDALEDARACAKIVLLACVSTGTEIEQWLSLVNRAIFPSSSRTVRGSSRTVRSTPSVSREGNEQGALYGEKILFTGKLEITRQEAADMAAKAGCAVVSGISKKVTILVVGVQNMSNLNGYSKSTKHRKAEQLIKQGVHIQILSESDFLELVDFVKPT